MLSPEEIGQAIAAARKREHLTQGELAALSGISERTLREVENGTGRTSLAAVLRVAGSVGVPLALGECPGD